jgi:hypothetical protein
VAPDGIGPLEAGAAALGVAAGAAEDAVAAAFGVVDAAAYQVSTPLCPLHAPCLVGVVVKDPSLHFPVVPAGAPAGA